MATTNPWEVSEVEYSNNLRIFNALTSGNRLMDGNTARNALLKSNLPPPILAQIWALADLDKDGCLDIREYSIAMRLALNCISGIPLSPQLPPSLLSVPQSFGNNMGIQPQKLIQPVHPSLQLGNFNIAPTAMQPSHPMGKQTPESERGPFSGKQCESWPVPHHAKLKYSQHFNHLDKQRLGWLSSQAGRSALGLSGLSTPVLAHIWFISDVNRDGKLNVDEFCIAMHMIDMFKNGYALPQATPPELAQMCGVSRSANNTPEMEPNEPPAQKSPAPKTFEDKRMDNFARGQAELERRRQLLMEEENRRRAELEKREREEEARRERERAEKERHRELERQQELEQQRIREHARQEEEKKRQAERDRQREEEEKQRKLANEKHKLKMLQSQKQQESERIAQKQQREKTLCFQLQALDEKSVDLDADVAKARDRISEITNEIENMRGSRDEKVQSIQSLQKENQKFAIESQELSHQLLHLQSANKETSSRKMNLDALRSRKLALLKTIEGVRNGLEEERSKKEKLFDDLKAKESIYKEKVYSKLLNYRNDYRKAFELLTHAQVQAQTKLSEHSAERLRNEQAARKAQIEAAAMATSSFPASNGNPAIPLSESRSSVIGSSVTSISSHETGKCRAIFPFEARSEDELSFEPGDVIIVFQGHAAEPGWAAGQLRDKVGWFPEAFVEPIAAIPSHANQPPIQNMPPNVTPSCSLDRIPEEDIVKKKDSEHVSPIKLDSTKKVICRCVAQFQWRARNEEDLSFGKGDLIEVVEQQEMKWKGRKANGECGWFPKSYVKMLPQTAENDATENHSNSVTSPTQNEPRTQNGLQSGDWYVALFDFEAAEATDLELKVGQKILVSERSESWWKGTCNGREGMFPANYVERIEGEHSSGQSQARALVDYVASAPNQLSLKCGDIVTVREKNGTGWWEGEVLRDGVTANGWFPGEYVKEIKENDVKISEPGQVTAVSMFDYVASQADELSFEVGDVIVVLDRADSEWWSGYKVQDASKVSRLFPANYVQLK